MQLTVIANQTSRDYSFAKKCVNRAYVTHVSKLNRKSIVHKWYTSGDFQEAKWFLHNAFPQLVEGIDYKAMGLKWYWGL